MQQKTKSKKKLVKKIKKLGRKEKKKLEDIEIKEETEEPKFEEVSLEEQVLDFDQVDLDDLRDFISKPPVLNQVAVAPRSFIRLEGGIDDSPTIPGTEENDPTKYLTKTSPEEVKYTNMSHIDISLQRPDFERDRGERTEIDQRTFWKTESSSNEKDFERYDLVKRMDVNKAGREREEDKKERKYDFRPPKP